MLVEITKEHQEKIDSLYLTPKERSEQINGILQTAAKELGMDHSMMDVTCFAIQWLAMLAVSNLSDNKDFVRIARLSNIWLHHHHYNAAEQIYGPPDRKEEG